MEAKAMGDLEKQLQLQFITLKFAIRKANDVIADGVERELKREINTLSGLLDKVYELKAQLLQLKIAAEVEANELGKWSDDTDGSAEGYEAILKQLRVRLREVQDQERDALFQRDMEEEEKRIEALEIRRQEIRRQVHAVDVDAGAPAGGVPAAQRVKLPKLTITSFNGTHLDWERFWSQFEAEVDKAQLAEVTKFSYLKEFVIPSVRCLINGLPFTAAGYQSAKEVLKKRFGQESEVVNAHIQEIMNLPSVPGANPSQVHAFYQKLVTHVQALSTMGKLEGINGYVRNTLDRLPKIRADLVRMDAGWKEWEFPDLVKALEEWTERNPVNEPEGKDHHKDHSKESSKKSSRSFQAKQSQAPQFQTSKCLFCEEKHKASECTTVKELTDRRQHFSSKKLCFNCGKNGHVAAKCKSTRGCAKCGSKHHTSLCDKPNQKPPAGADDKGQVEPLMCSPGSDAEEVVTHPVVVVVVNGQKCRALLDSGSGTCYASSSLLGAIRSKPVRHEVKNIEMLMDTVRKKIEIHKLTITSTDSSFELVKEVSKVEKDVLLKLPNPRYEAMIKKYSHFQGITMVDTDKKAELPIHMVLGTGVGSNIKMRVLPRIGNPGEPIAEQTRFGWVIQSPGRELDTNSFIAHSSVIDHEQLCRLDVLGLEDRPEKDQRTVFDEFKEQLGRSEEGWYETDLMWKASHPELQNNKRTSLGRLSPLLNNLQKTPQRFKEYDDKIRAQLEEGIVEVAPEEPTGKEFYIPHKAVIRDEAESTKLRIVYDCSSRPDPKSPSLNECLEAGPSLYNRLRDILVRNRMLPIALTGDMKEAFLQIRVREHERDALRFHWIESRETLKTVVLRFTRPLFGLIQSPFILGATTEVHLEASREEFPETVDEVRDNIYVDDVVDGGFQVDEVQKFKDEVIEVFRRAGFELHKWHSNVPSLESDSPSSKRKTLTELLGVYWDKERDLFAVIFPTVDDDGVVTLRVIFAFLGKVFDPMGLVSPIMLKGKSIFREVVELKIGWDKAIPEELRQKWHRWKVKLPKLYTVPRAIPSHRSAIKYIDLHGFGDASKVGCCSVVYVVVVQEEGTSQGLLVSNSRLAKRNLTIPRLELVALHMVANSLDNVRKALSKYPINKVIGWSDSSTALHWVRGDGKYKQFVDNRAVKVRSKKGIIYRHVPGDVNPADVGSRGCDGDKLGEPWQIGPGWLMKEELYPEDIVTTATEQTEAEAVKIKEVLATVVAGGDNGPLNTCEH